MILSKISRKICKVAWYKIAFFIALAIVSIAIVAIRLYFYAPFLIR